MNFRYDTGDYEDDRKGNGWLGLILAIVLIGIISMAVQLGRTMAKAVHNSTPPVGRTNGVMQAHE